MVGPRDGAGAALTDLARAIGFSPVERFTGPGRAEKQALKTPLVFFLCAAVPEVLSLRPVAKAIRFSSAATLRFSPLIYFARDPSIENIRQCIRMGFDDVIALPYAGGDLRERIQRQVGQLQIYYETATYFGPDRRGRTGSSRPDEGSGGPLRRIEIVRSERGVDVVRDDFQVVV